MSGNMLGVKDIKGLIADLMEKLGGPNGEEWLDGLKKFLRGELVESVQRWREEDEVIYFSVVSDGTTGDGWIERLKSKGFQISKWARDLLLSPDFKPTSGVKYEVAVLKGKLFTDSNRVTKNIRARADRRNWAKPSPEIVCLIREMFSDQEIEAMGLWVIVAMHAPIKDSNGDPDLLGASRHGNGRWLGACCDYPGLGWIRDNGFAFIVSQVALGS